MAKKRVAIPEQIKREVLTEAGYKCANPVCQTTLALDHHHIDYVSEGGGNEAANLIPLCPTCHSLHHKGVIAKEAILEWKERILRLNLKNKSELKSELAKKQLKMGFDGTLFPRLVRQLSQMELDILEWVEEGSPQKFFVELSAIAFGYSPSGHFRGSLGANEFKTVCEKLMSLGLTQEKAINNHMPLLYAQKMISITPLGQSLLQACRAAML